MPYIAALFEEQQDNVMRDAVHRISAGSAFVPQTDPFHLQILGGLHVYSDEAVNAAIANTPPLRGRFLKWSIVQQQLRADVECDPAVLSQLRAALPQGKPWRTFYVRIGSVAAIDQAAQDEFLAAVSAAFPMDASLEFTTYLKYHNVPQPQPKDAMQTVKTNNSKIDKKASKTNERKPPPIKRQSRLNPKALPFEPQALQTRRPGSTITKKSKKKKQKQKTSPHQKWERPTGVTGSSAVDAMIRSAAAAGS